MTTLNRVQIPEEFYDKTSDMLLVQPEPQYLYAELFLGALGADLAPPDTLGLNPERQIAGVGADYKTFSGDQLMLMKNKLFSEIIAAKVDFKGLPGNTVRINRPFYTNTTYTEVSRRIASGTTINQTPIAPQSQQTSLTLFRYGGPYDSTNSRVAPFGIEAFDAQMGVHKLAQIVGNQLKRDYHRFIDTVNVALLDLASTTVYPEGMSADNDATTAGSFPLTYEQVARTEAAMDNANLPTFADGFRVLVLTPTQLQQLKNDQQYQRASWNMPQYNILFPQYVASVNKFHVFKSTTLSIKANGSSVNVDYGHAIAPGALLAGMGLPPKVWPASEDNFGQTAKVVWLSDLAFGLSDNRFVVSVRSSE